MASGASGFSVITSTNSVVIPTLFTITTTDGDVVTDSSDQGGSTTYTAHSDTGGFPVGANGVGIDACNGNLTCLFASYPAFPGEKRHIYRNGANISHS